MITLHWWDPVKWKIDISKFKIQNVASAQVESSNIRCQKFRTAVSYIPWAVIAWSIPPGKLVVTKKAERLVWFTTAPPLPRHTHMKNLVCSMVYKDWWMATIINQGYYLILYNKLFICMIFADKFSCHLKSKSIAQLFLSLSKSKNNSPCAFQDTG